MPLYTQSTPHTYTMRISGAIYTNFVKYVNKDKSNILTDK